MLSKTVKFYQRKKKRKVNAGKWTSYGGKIDAGETELECAKRELESESGLQVNIHDLQKVAIIDFFNSETDVWRVHTYIITKFSGTPKSTEEMAEPKWFDIDTLDFDTMPWSDVYWLPLLLKYNKKLTVEIHQNSLLLKIEDMK